MIYLAAPSYQISIEALLSILVIAIHRIVAIVGILKTPLSIQKKRHSMSMDLGELKV
jgi:hypothetical protein